MELGFAAFKNTVVLMELPLISNTEAAPAMNPPFSQEDTIALCEDEVYTALLVYNPFVEKLHPDLYA